MAFYYPMSLIVCILYFVILSRFLNFQLLAKILHFMFTKVAWKSGWLKFVQERFFLSPCKMINLDSRCYDKCFSKNVSGMGKGVGQIHDTKI